MTFCIFQILDFILISRTKLMHFSPLDATNASKSSSPFFIKRWEEKNATKRKVNHLHDLFINTIYNKNI